MPKVCLRNSAFLGAMLPFFSKFERGHVHICIPASLLERRVTITALCVCVCERAGELFPINYLQDFLRPLYLLLLSWKHDIIRIADNIFYLLIKLSQSGFLWHELKHVCSEMQYNKCYWKKKKAHSDDVSITRIVKAYMHACIQGCYTTSLNINTWSKLQQPTQLQCWAAPARA